MTEGPERLNDDEDSSFNWEAILFFLRDLRQHYRLLIAIALCATGLVLLAYTCVSPQYAAQAIVGPPGPSPVDSLVSGGGAGATGVARRLFGGSNASSTSDDFQEYLELLHSSRLAKVLIEKDNILPRIFPKRWDAYNKRWRPTGTIHAIMTPIKHFLNRPVTDVPDIDMLTEALDKRLRVSRPGSAGVASLLTMNQLPYSTVTFISKSPGDAEQILSAILDEADRIIREDQRRNVIARLGFLTEKMPTVTANDQRDSLISILSSQEQLQMMIAADSRFASTMIDPPHASRNPTWPGNIFASIFVALMVSFASFVVLVFAASKLDSVRRVVNKFATKPTQMARPIYERQSL